MNHQNSHRTNTMVSGGPLSCPWDHGIKDQLADISRPICPLSFVIKNLEHILCVSLIMTKAMYLHHHFQHPVIPPSGKKSVGNWISGRPTVVSSWICLRYSQTLEHPLFCFALGSTVRFRWCFSAWHLVLSLMQCILHYLLTDCDTTNAL